MTTCPRRCLALAAAALAAVGLAAPSAHAVLGGDAGTIAVDQARLHGVRLQAVATSAPVATHEITLADGSSIRQFVTPDGIVFAVAWSTRFKPDLNALLGVHAATYAQAASDAMKAAGIRRHAELRRGDLVVQSTAHLNAHVGRAWLQSLVPAGARLDALR
jgi:hypothetical protein